MTVDRRPLHELNHDGRVALVRALGVVGALRFLGQFTTGRGDYTAERDAMLGTDDTLEDLFEQVRDADRQRPS